MLLLILTLSLAQTDVAPPPPVIATDAPQSVVLELPTPPPPPPVVLEPPPPEFKPNTFGRKAGFFAEPRVGVGALLGRVGLGTLTGAAGGALGLGFGVVGTAFGFIVGSAVPVILGGLLAVAALATGNALGAAAFGHDYGKDMADTILVALGTALVSTACVFVAALVFSTSVLVIPLVALAVLAPMSTPLWVQLLKKPLPAEGPQAALTLARF